MNWHEPLQQVWAEVARLGIWGPVVFIPAHLACTLLFVPTAVLSLAGGALFGMVLGSAVVFAGSLFSAVLGFLAGRYFSRGWLLSKISHSEKFKALDEAVAAKGLRIVLLLRLGAIFPYTFLNYGLGLTKISFKDYVLATCAGAIPGTLAYVYLGTLARGVAEAAGHDRSVGPLQWTLMAAGLVATAILAAMATRMAKKVLREP